MEKTKRINWYKRLGCKKTGWIIKDNNGRKWEQVTTYPTLEDAIIENLSGIKRKSNCRDKKWPDSYSYNR